MDFGDTSIDKFGKSLLSQQRKRAEKERKKQERNELLGLAGSVGIGLYRNKLNKQREEFFNSAEIANQERQYQQGLDLYNNKIKTVYEAGTNSVGGLGNYLLNGVARDEATRRINARVEEGMVLNADDLGSAIDSYAREMVYGKENKGGGMLDRLTAAYNAGSKLRSKEDYRAYIERKADLPESVAGSMFRNIFSNKSREEMDADALERVQKNNQFAADSAAFKTLAASFDQGLSLRDGEKIAREVEKFTKDLKMKPDEVLTGSQYVPKERKVAGETVKWGYFLDTYTDSRTGTARTAARADSADPMSAKIFKDEEVKISGLQKVKTKHHVTGQDVEEMQATVTYVSGEKLGKFVVERRPSEELYDVDTATQTTKPVREAFRSRVETLIENSGDADYFRDSFTLYLENLSGELPKGTDASDALMGKVAVTAANIESQFGIHEELAKNIAAQITIDNAVYRAEMGNATGDRYQGADIVLDPQINGLRVLEALNTLVMEQPEIQVFLPDRDALNALVGDLISNDSITRFTGKVGGPDAKFSPRTRQYYVDKNQPRDRSILNNLFNIKLQGPFQDDYTVMDLIRDRANLRDPNAERNKRDEPESLRKINQQLNLTSVSGQI